MKGHFYRRGCFCKKKRCSCGSTWTFVVDIGIDPKTRKRRQKSKGGFKTKQEAIASASALIHGLNMGTYIEESHILFKDFVQQLRKD
ncbi:Arm DNA-binding domain-containing protein [Siminovitchia terrae]|uniref:Arm DNA-binding domain-containing protein n=1 Tax=Siminovitchia terrae TaxID=1914933 RepID=UPI0035711C6F